MPSKAMTVSGAGSICVVYLKWVLCIYFTVYDKYTFEHIYCIPNLKVSMKSKLAPFSLLMHVPVVIVNNSSMHDILKIKAFIKIS